jgi:hypothetical protein
MKLFEIILLTNLFILVKVDKDKLDIKIPQTITETKENKKFEKTILHEGEESKIVKRSLSGDENIVANHLQENKTVSVAFNRSMVIVWEKCKEARTQITKIFQSLNYSNEITLYFDPSINVLILRTVYPNLDEESKILRLPNFAGEILYFLFYEPGKFHIYYDCPSVSKIRLHMELADFENIEAIQLYKNSKSFVDLEVALRKFSCRTVLTVIPGTGIYSKSYKIFKNCILSFFNFFSSSL